MTTSASTAAILDFQLPVWSHSIQSVSVRLLSLKNRRIAVEILSPAGTEAEIRWGIFTPPPFICDQRM